MDNRHKPVDHARNVRDAWSLAETYRDAADRLGLDGWAIGVEPDPVPGPNGVHGFVIYAVPAQREPLPEPLPDEDLDLVMPEPRTVQGPSARMRHGNRSRRR